MRHIDTDVIKQATDRRMSEALRILAGSNKSVRLVHDAWCHMDPDQRSSTLSHVATNVAAIVNRHYETEFRKKSDDGFDELPTDDEGLVDVTAALGPAALEALGNVIHATGWGAQRVIDEAVAFLWKAMQAQLAPASAE